MTRRAAVTERLLRAASVVRLAASPAVPAVQHLYSRPSTTIALPGLPTGAARLEGAAVREPPGSHWRQTQYDSVAPGVYEIDDALVHSTAGIVATGPLVLAETLHHTTAYFNAYRDIANGIALASPSPVRLPGRHLSLLAGGITNYYHSMLESLARLLAVRDPDALDGVLVPLGAVGQAEMLGLLALPPGLAIREVAAAETLLVERLVLPTSVCGQYDYHPCVIDFFDRAAASVGPGLSFPRRLYLDRRGTRFRPLANEAEVIAALTPLGFVPVQPERLSLADQIRLFADAEMIVAPHGAGLTNAGFCRPGCVVIELTMDAYCNWCFRHLAALRGIAYDCVLGVGIGPWQDWATEVHAMSWEISTMAVVAAVEHGLGQVAAARVVPGGFGKDRG